MIRDPASFRAAATAAAALWPREVVADARALAADAGRLDVAGAQEVSDWPDHLPDPTRGMLAGHALALASWLSGQRRAGRRLRTLGLNGGQGSGKSTLSAMLRLALAREYGLRCVVLSIDDFYLTATRRRDLAARVHPLLLTRGVPGTHDVALALDTLDALEGGSGELALPAFDKARDDRYPVERWPRVELPVDLVVLEGWCVGAIPEPAERLTTPVNGLEADEDADGRWRRYVNTALAGPYQRLFARLDALAMLRVPGFDAVLRWRTEQEQRLRARREGGMRDAEIHRFVMHYERLTRYQLEELPARADMVLGLDVTHAIRSLRLAAATDRVQG